ncbi:MAG TPA: protein-L-isoaspartate(D-aspartate) O-methyltransferase [Pelovirga sp.]|nr:protein-L-isoaspartate(D-aspartate) O-methyltransferase [Pelovirga sp.]
MDYAVARRRMVQQQIVSRGIEDPRLIEAMNRLPRHFFVDEGLGGHAYADGPLPIGHKQTISQPYMVAAMSAALDLQGQERVLEIGTGSGYQTAILAMLAKRVYSVERIANLAARARKVLDQLHISNVNIKTADGTLGWKDQAPFDGILVAAGAPDVPLEYLAQLAVGGKLVLPVGGYNEQNLLRITRLDNDQFKREELMGCRFVPLIGAAGWSEADES